MPRTANITKRVVDALKPGRSPFDIFDAAVRGFHVRTHPSGLKSYRFKYVASGKQRVVTIGEHGAFTPDAAREQARELRGLVKRGGDPIADAEAERLRLEEQRRRAITVADLIERWLEEGPSASPGKRSWQHDASRLRWHVVPLLGSMPAASVRRVDIENVQRDIASGKTAAERKTKLRGRAIVTGGRGVAPVVLASLSSCYSWAVARELVPNNPVKGVKREKPRKLERYLSESDASRLFETLTAMEREGALLSVFADAIRILLLTGARKSEITELKWSEVDLERGLITLPRERSKTGEKTIPINAPAAAILARRARSGAFVLPSPRDQEAPAVGLPKAWARVRRRADLCDVRLHDLRHSFASFAVAGGASLPILAKALGHSQTATTERYAHLGANPVRELAERVGAVIVGANHMQVVPDAKVVLLARVKKP